VVGGVAFTLHGRVGLDRGTARPFLLWPDERTTAPDAAKNQFRLPMFVMDPEQWRWLGDGRGDGGEITGQGGSGAKCPEGCSVQTVDVGNVATQA